MKLISAQPNDPYFAWQLEVQINNFRKYDLASSMQVLLFKNKQNDKYKHIWDEIIEDYPEVNFFFYDNHGCKYLEYIPSLRPHVLKQHFQKFPELEDEIIFYHDSDIIFTKYPRLDKLIHDNICYVSDTTGYLNSKYIKGKVDHVKNESFRSRFEQEDVVRKLSNLVGLSDLDFIANDNNMGGAQYLLKGLNYDFWDNVERHCVDIYRYLGHVNRTYFSNENKGIQRWCADMWAIALNLIKRNKTLRISKELDFSWPRDHISKDASIYHNAGVSSKERNELFWKGGYIYKNPFEIDHSLYVSKDTCNSLYVNELRELSENKRVVNRYKC